MSTVDECVAVAKGVARKIRADVTAATNGLSDSDKSTVYSVLGYKLQALANELATWEPPPVRQPPMYVRAEDGHMYEVDKEVRIVQGIIIPIESTKFGEET